MRISYCNIDHDVFITQYQTPSSYVLQIRNLKNPLVCNKFEINAEVTCHLKVGFSVENNIPISGIFFGTTHGRVKFFNVSFLSYSNKRIYNKFTNLNIC